MFEQFSQNLHSMGLDDDDEEEEKEEENMLWDRSQAAEAHLSPNLKYQRMSASWRRSNNADR
jgi:hypothetical protein